MQLSPDDGPSQALNRAGQEFFAQRSIRQALRCFLAGLRSGGDPRECAFERWACWMLLGEFENAWRESDRVVGSFRCVKPLAESHVAVHCLHGLGDAIQFIRYIPGLRAICRSITVRAAECLLPLFASLAGIDRAVPLDRAVRGADWEIECSDLPYLFRTTIETIPSAAGYLSTAPDAKTPFENRSGLHVGIVWAAGTWASYRSISAGDFESLARIPGVTLFSLQVGDAARNIPRYVRPVDLSSSVLATARAMRLLDLIITVDTMSAHLAGALGIPVWTLLPFAADWRWMLRRSDSPWYSSMRLFRQPAPGDWGSVIKGIARELRNLAENRSSAADRDPTVRRVFTPRPMNMR